MEINATLAAGLGARGTGEPGGLQLTLYHRIYERRNYLEIRRKYGGTREAGMA